MSFPMKLLHILVVLKIIDIIAIVIFICINNWLFLIIAICLLVVLFFLSWMVIYLALNGKL